MKSKEELEKEVAEVRKKYLEKKEKREKSKLEAMDFNQKFVDSGEKYISIRIRTGYIGRELDASGRKLQTERSKPRGTMVAIKGDDGEIYIGAVYKSNKDIDIPAVGVQKALTLALEARKEGVPLKCSTDIKPKDKELAEFFRIRSKCYFWPEKFSHTRGETKLEYPNYEKIRRNRNRVLCC